MTGNKNTPALKQRSGRASQKRGFNLIESAIVLGVVGLVIGGIWYAAAAMYENYKFNKVANGFMVIAQNTMPILIEFQSMSAALTTAEAESLGVLVGADGFLSNGTKILTPINGLYFRIGGGGGGPGLATFTLYGKMTSNECIGIMLKLTAAMQNYKPRLSNENHSTSEGDILRISLIDDSSTVLSHFYQEQSPNNANLHTQCNNPLVGGIMMYWYRMKS